MIRTVGIQTYSRASAPKEFLAIVIATLLAILILGEVGVDDTVLKTGHHPVAHKSPGRANLSDQDWLNYWASYYRKSKQLKKADEKSWKATREIWMRKLVQAKRIRCQECTRIVKLWLKNYGYGPKKVLLQEGLERASTVRRS